MTITMEQVLAELQPDEPNYKKAAKLGSDALPHLEQLVKTADPLLASKAAYLASLIPDEKSATVLRTAAQSSFTEVRVAAAFGSRNLSMQAVKDVLETLKVDNDSGVRKQALKSIESLQ